MSVRPEEAKMAKEGDARESLYALDVIGRH